jgi:hypothetical protein
VRRLWALEKTVEKCTKFDPSAQRPKTALASNYSENLQKKGTNLLNL